ncbi:MAG: 50S ribosomal protein L30 [Chloroflexota bacterium]
MAAERTPAAKSGPLLTVTWTRSTIGHKAAARGTIRALGLHRLNQTVQVADTPVIRGMLRRVAFLIEVEEPAGAKEGKST